MHFFSKIKESLSKGKLRKKQVEELNRLFQAAVADGNISDREIYRINEFYRESELSHEDFQNICDQFFLESVGKAINDRRVAPKEFEDLMDMSHKLNIQDSNRLSIIQNLKIYQLLNNLEKSEPLPT